MKQSRRVPTLARHHHSTGENLLKIPKKPATSPVQPKIAPQAEFKPNHKGYCEMASIGYAIKVIILIDMAIVAAFVLPTLFGVVELESMEWVGLKIIVCGTVMLPVLLLGYFSIWFFRR